MGIFKTLEQPQSPSSGGMFSQMEQQQNTIKVGGVPLSLGQKINQFRNEAVAPYVARQQETNQAQKEGRQTILDTALQTSGNVIGAGIAPVGKAIGATINAPYNPAGKFLGSIVEGATKTAGFIGDQLQKIPGVKKLTSSNEFDVFQRDLSAMSEWLNLIPIGAGAKRTASVLGDVAEATKVGAITNAKAEIPKITQSIIPIKNKGNITRSIEPLSSIDATGIKTYGDLASKLQSKTDEVLGGLDAKLAQDTRTFKNEQLQANETVKTKFGEATVQHNYVDDALQQLDELYTKTNDPANKAIVDMIRQKAETEGLTVQEINNLAKKYGTEFKEKAFTKVGDPMTSVNAQTVENTRGGIKDTARQLSEDRAAFEAADKEAASLIKVQGYAKQMEEQANLMKAKIKKYGIGQNIGRLIFQTIDVATGKALSGGIQALFPRGQGIKLMNAMELEQTLQKNLKKLQELQKVIDSGKSPNEILKTIQSTEFPTNQPTKINANTNSQNILDNNTTESRADRMFRRQDEEYWKSQGFEVLPNGDLRRIVK